MNEVTTVKRVALIVTLFLLSGCTDQPSLTTAKPDVDYPSGQTVRAQPVTSKMPDEPVQADSAAAQVLLRFADLVTKGETRGAADLLAPNLRGVYQLDDYAPIRNTPRMEIVKLVEMTGTPNWNADVGARGEQAADFRVFAVDARYHVLGIIHSSFKDGEVHHHKATVTKDTADGPWLISELSGVGH
jgi:hypothetical protein